MWSKDYSKVGFHDDDAALRGWFELLESNGFRLFHKEINAQYGASCCIEYGFIHKDLKQVFGTQQLAAYFQSAIENQEKHSHQTAQINSILSMVTYLAVGITVLGAFVVLKNQYNKGQIVYFQAESFRSR